MAKANKCALILGHIFVKSAHQHTVQVTNSEPPRYFARHFRLDSLCKTLPFQGVRGSRVFTGSSSPFSSAKIRDIRPDFIILDLGINDLAMDPPPS